MTLSSSPAFDILLLSCFSHHPQLWCVNAKHTRLTKRLKFLSNHDSTTGVWFCVRWCCKAWHGCVLWAGLFKGKTWLSPLFTVGMWHWQSALLPTSYQLTREHMPVSANWWLALYERVCVSVCVQQALAKRFVWASVGRTGHSSFPALEPALYSSHACYSQ